jgi:hypothetical protein
MSKSATTGELDKLHNEFAKKLKNYLVEGETIVVAGEERKTSCSAAMMNVIRGFLKDNHVECDAGHPSPQVGAVADALEEFNSAANDEDEAPHFN